MQSRQEPFARPPNIAIGPFAGRRVMARDVAPFVLGAVMLVAMTGWLLLH